MKRNNPIHIDIISAAALIAVCVVGRLLPHSANFTPLAACALFAGFLVSRRAIAFAVPVAAMIMSDAFIGGYNIGVMLIVYAAMAMPVFMRPLLGDGRNPLRIGGCALASSIAFFLATNFAHWALMGMYDRTLSGLVSCYVAAIPFFRNTLAGDMFFAAVLFGGYAFLARPAVRPALQQTA